MQIAIAAEVPERRQDEATTAVALRPGATIMQKLLSDNAPDGLNFSFNRVQFLPGDKAFRSARHHHAFQQIRFAEKGAINYGPDQYIPEGAIAYFPRGAYYGPQLKDQGIGMTVQLGFGGEKQSGKLWERYSQDAIDSLKARGRLEDDVFIDTDPDTGKERRRDAVDVIYEIQHAAHTNAAFVIPPEGYDAPILMHPEAFEFYEIAPGVEIKELGRFFDHPGPNADVRIAVLRLSGGGRYTFSPDRGQVAWAVAAGLEVDGRKLPELSSVYSPRAEEISLAGDGGLEVFVVELPRLD